jgi:hypothetical protein
VFQELGRPEAEALAARLHQALEAWAGGGEGAVEPVPAPGGLGYWVRAAVDTFTFLACRRAPGQAYQPMVFPTRPDAATTAASIAAILRPAVGAGQELYFNTRDFAR